MTKALLPILMVLTTWCKGATLESVEDSIAFYHQKLKLGISDAQRDSVSEKIRQLFIGAFDQPETFEYPFNKFNFSKITSSDGRVRLFNWNVPYSDNTHKYYCFVLVRNPKDKTWWWTELNDSPREGEKIENKFLTEDKWMGTLYYEIIPMDRKKGDTYTLLGWDGKDNLTQRKIIDALTISGKKIRLGAPLFKSDDGTRKRIIYEYSDEVSASVRYFAKKKCIVVDHLSPRNPNMTGIYADYGPDGSYDMLQMVKGKWELVENIDVGQFSEDDDKPYVDPRKRP